MFITESNIKQKVCNFLWRIMIGTRISMTNNDETIITVGLYFDFHLF